MRTLAALLIVCVGSAQVRADANADDAKEVAVAFLKGLKAQDVDAVLKVTAAPFADCYGVNRNLIKDETALKKWVKEWIEQLTDPALVPTELGAIHTYETVREMIRDEDVRELLDDVVGKGGFVAVVRTDGKLLPILVRIKDGKASVVGLGREKEVPVIK
jgi:hypothetical protein